MWLLSKEFRFEAAHYLPYHNGKCGRLHGHSWVGRIYVYGDHLVESGTSSGMIIDYADIKKALTPLVDQYLDHHYLNESIGLTNPTSEEIARWLFNQLEHKLPGLQSVEIMETCTSSCRYFGGRCGLSYY